MLTSVSDSKLIRFISTEVRVPGVSLFEAVPRISEVSTSLQIQPDRIRMAQIPASVVNGAFYGFSGKPVSTDPRRFRTYVSPPEDRRAVSITQVC